MLGSAKYLNAAGASTTETKENSDDQRSNPKRGRHEQSSAGVHCVLVRGVRIQKRPSPATRIREKYGNRSGISGPSHVQSLNSRLSLKVLRTGGDVVAGAGDVAVTGKA